MNKNIKLAVAGAVLALSASAANAGIVIPAGDWTLDIGGNVNTYVTSSKNDDTNTVIGGLAGNTGKSVNNITTGLLPNYLSVSGTTRQNDLDVSFTISINPGSSTVSAGRQSSQQENRQAFLTFGDKSWGSVKVGKDIGVFASDAILNDMTLLGVGSAANSLAGNTTTLGRIGSGFIYADWKAQLAYTTPNFNGFQATVAMTQAWDAQASNSKNTSGVGNDLSAWSDTRGAGSPAWEGKASYSFAANDVTGKIWVSGLAQKVGNLKWTSYTSATASTSTGTSMSDTVVYGGDIGINLNVAGLGLTGYYYDGSGIGRTVQLADGFSTNGTARDSNGGYVQATYVLPTKTKAGISWGVSKLDLAGNDTAVGGIGANQQGWLVKENRMTTVGLYHPLTKHLNLVGEYSYVESENQKGEENATHIGSLGAIMFF